MYLCGNHWATILMPTTNPAPTPLSASREIIICVNVSENANTIVGIDMTIISQVKTILAPYRSISAPTTMRAGMVSATLAISRTLMCSFVNQSELSRMVVASGARLNHTKNVMKNAIHVKCRTRMRSWSKSRRRGAPSSVPVSLIIFALSGYRSKRRRDEVVGGRQQPVAMGGRGIG